MKLEMQYLFHFFHLRGESLVAETDTFSAGNFII